MEAILPQSNWPATVDHVIFVASTHGGTHLADPARWHDLVDLYTNLVTVGAAGLALVPGGAPVAAVVGGVVRGIGALVKHLVSYAAEGDDVPGLAAMIPGGPFVTDLNGSSPASRGPGTNWHVVSSNFHVSLSDGSHRPPEFPRELVVRLGEGFVDRLFEGDNDLVVDTASMSAIGPASGGYVKDVLDLRHERRGLPHELLRPDARHRGDRGLAATRHGSGRGPRDRRRGTERTCAARTARRNVRRS